MERRFICAMEKRENPEKIDLYSLQGSKKKIERTEQIPDGEMGENP